MAIVTMRYWAAAKEAAGAAEDKVQAATLAEALAASIATARERGPADRAERFRQVLARSSFVIDETPAGTRPPESVSLAGATVVEVLPPFAGG